MTLNALSVKQCALTNPKICVRSGKNCNLEKNEIDKHCWLEV